MSWQVQQKLYNAVQPLSKVQRRGENTTVVRRCTALYWSQTAPNEHLCLLIVPQVTFAALALRPLTSLKSTVIERTVINATSCLRGGADAADAQVLSRSPKWTSPDLERVLATIRPAVEGDRPNEHE